MYTTITGALTEAVPEAIPDAFDSLADCRAGLSCTRRSRRSHTIIGGFLLAKINHTFPEVYRALSVTSISFSDLQRPVYANGNHGECEPPVTVGGVTEKFIGEPLNCFNLSALLADICGI